MPLALPFAGQFSSNSASRPDRAIKVKISVTPPGWNPVFFVEGRGDAFAAHSCMSRSNRLHLLKHALPISHLDADIRTAAHLPCSCHDRGLVLRARCFVLEHLLAWVR